MYAELPSGIRPRNALTSPPPEGATFASFSLFVSLAALIAIIYAGSEWWHVGGGFGFSSDSAWSRAVFARNVASGHGLSFNPGTLAPGAVAPTWIGLLAGAGALMGSVSGAKVVGAVCVILTAFLAWRIVLDLLGDWRFAFLAGLLVAASPRLMAGALGGGEVALAGLLAAALMYWQAVSWEGGRHQRVVAAIAASLAALSRPELILLLPLMVVDRWVVALCHSPRGRRLGDALSRSLPELLIAALVLSPYLIHNWSNAGPLWQQPEAALRAQPGLAWPLGVLGLLWAENPLLASAALLGLPVAVLRAARAGARHPSFLPALIPLAAIAAPGFIWRYAAQEAASCTATFLVPAIVVLASAGLFFLKRGASGPGAQSRSWAPRLGLVTGIVLAIAGLGVLSAAAHRTAWLQHGLSVRKVSDLQGYIGRWAAEHTAVDASIASREVGAIAFFSKRRVVDLGGTIGQEGIEYLRRSAAPDSNLLAFLQEAQPSHLAIRPSDFPDLAQRADLLTPAVTCGEQDPYTGGITTWVLYETPWPSPSVRAASGQARTRRRD